MNYYRRYLGDYMRDTMHLSMMEHGAYGCLLDIQYATEKPLPADYDALYRMCRAMSRAEQDAIRKVADEFFPLADGGRFNPRAGRELKVAQATIGKQRESGVESARKRWSTYGSTHNSTDGSTDAASIQPPTTNHHPPTTTPQPPASNLQPPEVKTKGAGAARPGRVNGKDVEPPELPEWLPRLQWDGWIEARRKARHPPTNLALRLALSKLEDFRERGLNVAQILAQSAMNNWSDLYEPKG